MKYGKHVLTALLLGAAAPAFAHSDGLAGGFMSGFMHPVLGWDHVVAMVAVGLWGAFLGAPALWLLPVVFPLVMAFGGALGVMGVPLPGVETGIALSAIVLGGAVALAARPPLWVAAVVVGAFAIFHGHAHGTELPHATNPLAYSLGFVTATGLLHLCGISFGLLVRWPAGRIAVRAGGGLIALLGLGFLTGGGVTARQRAAALGWLMLAWTAPAAAHGTVPGIAGFYAGVVHPYTTAPHLLALLAGGLLLGQRRLAVAGPAIATLFGAVAAGLLLARLTVSSDAGDRLLLPLAAALALAAVCRAALPRWALFAVAVSLGLLVGLGSLPEPGVRGLNWLTPVGTVIGAGLCTTFSAQAADATEGWDRPAGKAARIGVRIVASWVAAASLLVLALALRAPG